MTDEYIDLSVYALTGLLLYILHLTWGSLLLVRLFYYIYIAAYGINLYILYSDPIVRMFAIGNVAF